MRVQQLSREGTPSTTSILVFDIGDEVIETLEEYVRETGLQAAHFSAVGAFEHATIAYFDWTAREYQDRHVDHQVEVASLLGDIALQDGEPVIHAHCVLGQPDGSALAGHLRAGHVRPTLELVLTVHPAHLRREHDAESGLALIHPEERNGTR